MIPLLHLSLAAADRTTLCVTLTECLRHVRKVVASFGGRLLLFCVADDHIHCVFEGPRGEIGSQLSGLVRSLKARGYDMQEAHLKPVDGRRHLESLVRYIVRQPEKHGLPGHPALWPGSCFVDLVGARRLEGFDPQRVLLHLPRWRPDDVWRALGLPPMEPLADRAARRLGPWRIVDAAYRAFAVERTDGYRLPSVRRARRAAVAVADEAGVPATELANALGITRRSVRRLKAHVVPVGDRCAVRLRLALEQHVGLPREGIGAAVEPVS